VWAAGTKSKEECYNALRYASEAAKGAGLQAGMKHMMRSRGAQDAEGAKARVA
jgi:hypothetical protein